MRPVDNSVSFPKLEKNILEFWKKNNIIHKGLEANFGKEPYIFYDGPPFATGLPHYGHILAGTIKDIVPRYWVMKGKYVQRRWGWDCHGLPVEYEMEKELELSGAHDIEKYGVGKFNEACRNIVLRYTNEWEKIVERTGRWVNFKSQYRTMDKNFMESVWWMLRQLWDKDLVFEGYRVMPYSWRISTPLSNFEANLNYKEVQDPAITVKFKCKEEDYYFLAWTTTPWTLPANMGVTVNPDADYSLIFDKQTNENYILATDLIPKYFKSSELYVEKGKLTGLSLAGKSYEPLFPFFKDKPGAFKVFADSYVTLTDGTGIVHCAPAHGEDDFRVWNIYNKNLPIVDATDAEGNFTEKAFPYKGKNFKEADKEIIKDLKSKNLIYRHETIMHNYAHCWRTETPLMNKAISTWFVKMDPIKENLIQNNLKTHWVPEHLKEGRFGKWLENARDWNISRNRYWGTPIPIWRNKQGESICISSIAELEKLTGKKLDDIHKHFVDDLEIPSTKGNDPLRRIPEVLDCWFESGSMPYAQEHYPFENKEKFEKNFPADFIAEGLDQTRGWFYTLSVLSTALFNKPPFKNVIVNGLVLASDGKKMSKRLKNYPEATEILDQFGADALRVFLVSSPASHAEELKFSEAGVKEVVRAVLLPYWNAYSFFVTYALADKWEKKTFQIKKIETLENELDHWIVSRLHTLIKNYDKKMAQYHLADVVPEVLKFVDELTNWYIRLNRRRFWSEEKNKDKDDAYQTLYYILIEFSKLLAPLMPFVTEEVFQNLKSTTEESIHLTAFPKLENKLINNNLEEDMQIISNVVFMGRNLRSVHNIKTRQPLSELKVIIKDKEKRSTIERHANLIKSELNVKKVSFTEKESDWVQFTAKPNLKILGPKLGQKMKVIAQKIKDLKEEELSLLEKYKEIRIEGELLNTQDILIERLPKQEGLTQTDNGVTVWMDSKVTEDLLQEGYAREIVNRIQKMRKDMNLQVTDKINLFYKTSEKMKAAIEKHKNYIQEETLSQSIEYKDPITGEEHEIDGILTYLSIYV